MKTAGKPFKQEDIAPPPKHRGWLSSNMAQMMVFINGLVLTITAFITLNIFIEELVYNEMQKTAVEVNERVDRELFNAERTLAMIASTFSLLPEGEGQRISNISLETMEKAQIAQLYLLNKETDGSFTIGVSAFTNNDRRGYRLTRLREVAVNNYLHFISHDTFDRDNPTHLYTNLTGLEVESRSGRKTPIALAYPIYYGENLGHVLVAVFVLEDLIQSSWFQQQSTIHDVSIRAVADEKVIYHFQSSESGDSAASTNNLYRRSFENKLANQPLTIDVNILPGERDNFLVKVPLLMLLFGITLTLIGTLYVRNNQRQSEKLARVNRELAQKNYELHNQMGEGVRLNQVIQKQERDNRAIIDSVSDIIFETSITGDILFLNETWHRVTGFHIEQSLRRNLFDMLYLQDQREQRANFEALVKGKKKSYRAFTRLRTSDGTFRSVELAVSMIRQDENKELRIVGTITDMEERRRAERALAEAEKKYRTIVENAAGGIYQATPEGIFLSANPAAARILGYENTDVMLRDVRNVNTQLYNDAAARERFLADVARSDQPQRCEAQMVRADGLIIWVAENLRAVRDEDRVLLYFEGSLEDITQRKEAEIAMSRAKMESDVANRAKSEFLANMSHELRTPLNAIIGFSEIIKNESFGPIGNKDYWSYANDIYESGRRLLSVINEILDVSRIQAGERQLNEGVVSIQRVAQSCIELMRAKAEAGHITINNQLEATDMQLIGEAQAIKQMMLNLLSNAVKFTPDGGVVTMSGEIDDAGQYRLSITDTGQGLTPDEIKKALSPFGQIDSDHNRKKSGTGLGLTLVDALIGLHGGSIELISQKGIGTTATLIFPARRVSPKAGAKTSVVDRIREDL